MNIIMKLLLIINQEKSLILRDFSSAFVLFVLTFFLLIRDSTQTTTRRSMCYSTLLYNEGMLTEMRVLGKSLKDTNAVTEHGYPMIAFVTDGVTENSKNILKDDGWRVKEVNLIENPNDIHPSHFQGVYTKLKIFELYEECDKVVFLDADTFVVKNPNKAFEACPGFCVTMRHSERFNSGVMVVKPGKSISDKLQELASTTESYTGGDQGMLNTLFNEMADAPMIHTLNGGRSFRVGLDDSFVPPSQLGMRLARLSTGFNAEPAMQWVTNRWSHPGGYVVDVT